MLCCNLSAVCPQHNSGRTSYAGVHITGTQVRMRENNQQCVMPLVLLRALAYLTDLMLIVSNQQHVISVSTSRVNTSRLSVSRSAELRCRRVRAHREEKKSLAPPTILGSAVMRAHRWAHTLTSTKCSSQVQEDEEWGWSCIGCHQQVIRNPEESPFSAVGWRKSWLKLL